MQSLSLVCSSKGGRQGRAGAEEGGGEEDEGPRGVETVGVSFGVGAGGDERGLGDDRDGEQGERPIVPSDAKSKVCAERWDGMKSHRR